VRSTITSQVLNGSGTFLYQWQSSPDGSTGWANVGNSDSYTVPSSIPGTTYYRVVVTDAASGCNDPVSNVISVTIVEQPLVDIVVDNPLVCIGGTSILNSNITNGSGVYNYQWQSSPNGTAWSNISPNGNNASYTSIATAAGTTYYRMILTDLSNGCDDPVSNTLTIVVEPIRSHHSC
jgi:hypothetical protein